MPKCVHCKSNSVKKNGKTKLGYQQYKCKDCGKHFSDNPHGIGRPLIGDKPMTSTERTRRQRSKQIILSEVEARAIIKETLENHNHLWYSQRSEDRIWRTIARTNSITPNAIATTIEEFSRLSQLTN